MLGRDDFVKEFKQDMKMPLGLDKLMNSVVKQLEKSLQQGMPKQNAGVPHGFKIQISTGQPVMRAITPKINEKTVEEVIGIPEEEYERRRNLKKVEAKSNIKRLSDNIVYELNVPGVKSKRDVVITRLENSIEVKAYSKDKCYYKTIPLNVAIMGYKVSDDKIFLELKS
jgi:HSP20 family molecular chaperone IbpA